MFFAASIKPVSLFDTVKYLKYQMQQRSVTLGNGALMGPHGATWLHKMELLMVVKKSKVC